MAEPLRVMIVAPSAQDIQPLLAALRRENPGLVYERVADLEPARDALSGVAWDALLAFPNAGIFGVLSLFRLARKEAPDVPFIFIADPRDEASLTLAAEAGIEEFVFNDRLARLMPGIRKSRRAIVARRERERVLNRLRESEARFRKLIENSHQCIVVHRRFKPLFVNRALVETLGYGSAEEVLALDSVLRWIAPHEHARLNGYAQARIQGQAAPEVYEFEAVRKDGSKLWLQNVSQVVDWEEGPAIQSVYVDITAHREAEQALRASEHRFTLLADQSQDLIFRYRLWPSRGFEFVSQSATQFVGYTPEEHYADPDLGLKIVHPDDRAALLETMADPERLDRPMILRWIRKDGAVIWAEIRSTLIRDSEGRAIAVQGISRDVTERVRTEEKLRGIVEGSIQGILVYRDAKPLFANTALASLHGFAGTEEVLALDSIEKLIAEDEVARMRSNRIDRMSGGKVPDLVEFRARRKDGAHFWVEQRARVIDWEGRSAILSMVVDITARKEAESRLRASEERYRLITESVQDVIFRYSLWPERGIEFVSHAVTRMTGYTPEEFYADAELGFKIVHPDERAKFDEFSTDPAVLERPIELRWVRKDGAPLWVEIRNTIIRDPEGRATAIQGITRDISERVRSEERLRSIVEGSIQGILVHRELKPLFVNEAYARIHGFSGAEEVLALESVEGLFDPEELERLRGYRHARLAGLPAPNRYEYRARRTDGSLIWVENMARVLKWEGEPAILSTLVDISARKEAEIRLRASEELHRLLTESAQDFIYRYQLSPEKGFDYASPGCVKLCGYTPEEHYADPEIPFKIVHADDRHILSGYFEKPPLEPITLTVRLIRKDGSMVWTEHRNSVVIGPDGTPVAIEGSVRDITERMQSEERFRLVVQSAPYGMLIVNEAGAIVQVNTQLERDFGYSRDELAGQPEEILMPRSGREAHVRLRSDYLKKPGTRPMGSGLKLTGRKKNGSEFPLEISLSPFVTSQGTMVLAAIQDITERRAAEETMRSQKRLLEAVFDALPLWVTVKDREGRFLLVNRRLASDIGKTAEWFSGRNAGELAWGTEEEKRHILALDAQAMASGDLLQSDGVALVGGDGRPHVFNTVRVPLREAEGQVSGLVTVSSDVTGQRALQEQFNAAQKMEAVGRLAGGVAHDFNNILAVILSYAQFVLDELPPEGAARDDVNEVLRAAERAAALTRQLLAFSRRQDLQLRIIDLNTVVEDLEKMLQRLIGEDIRLATRLDENLWWVKADTTQIEQVIMNLAVNARDAMPGGGTLSIETRNRVLDAEQARGFPDAMPGEFVELAVRDNGAGMEEAVRLRIFEPFFTTKEKGKGTGLGLATVYGIVKQLEGTIAVESEPGQGTAFRILLPRHDAPSSGEMPASRAAAVLTGDETILLVEDNESVRAAARRILESHGYHVLEAPDWRPAVAWCEDPSTRIDLLLTDVVMPELSGPALSERLQLLRPSLRVMFMSGYTDDMMTQHGLTGENVRLLQKPFTIESLLTMVREVLRQDGEAPAPVGTPN